MIRKLRKVILRILKPWGCQMNSLWYQQRTLNAKISNLAFRVNELELATETVKPAKAKRGRPRKQPLKPQTLKGVRNG